MIFTILFLCHKINRGDIISVLKIDLDKIISNVKKYKSQMNKNEKFCAVIKANAYGMGSKQICGAINDFVDYFAVSCYSEFLQIKNVSSKPILLLDTDYENITKLVDQNCEICVSNFEQFKLLIKNNTKINSVAKIHIAVNTGMNRFGFNNKSDIKKIFEIVNQSKNIKIVGIFSHLFDGENKISVQMQKNKLLSLKNYLEENFKIDNIIFHISNTPGFETDKCFDMFRIGIGLYLFDNDSCFSLSSKIIEIQEVKKGEQVGYCHAFVADCDIKIAVVAIGYADGVFRKISGRGFVLIRGIFCKILAVCMDSILVDLSNISAKIGDEVVLIGKSGENEIFVCDVALWCDTIVYEIMTSISQRVKRVYTGGFYANNHRKISCKKTCCS